MAVATWKKLPSLPKKESGHKTLYLPSRNQIALLGKQHLVKDASDDNAEWSSVTIKDSTFRKALPKTVTSVIALNGGEKMLAFGKTLIIEHTALINLDESGTIWTASKCDALKAALTNSSVTQAGGTIYIVGTEYIDEINRNPCSFLTCPMDDIDGGWEEFEDDAIGVGPTSKSISIYPYKGNILCLSKPDDNNSLMRVHKLDPEEYAWTELSGSGSAPGGLTKYAAAIVGDHLVVYGGLLYETNVLLRTVNPSIYCLDLKLNVWTEATQVNAPEPRFSHAACLDSKGRLIVTGGAYETGSYDDVYALEMDFTD